MDISQLGYSELSLKTSGLIKYSIEDEEEDKVNPNKLVENFVPQETAAEQEERIRLSSPFGHLQSWMLCRLIVKANDDVRQE